MQANSAATDDIKPSTSISFLLRAAPIYIPSIQAKSKPPTAAIISIGFISKVPYLSQASTIIFFFLLKPSSDRPPPLPTTISMFSLVTEYRRAELVVVLAIPISPFEKIS